MSFGWLDERPLVVAIAGPNGAGKSTFFHTHIAPSGLRFVNADRLASELSIDAYSATAVAEKIRHAFVAERESFAFETVFSDPVGDKLSFLESCERIGYTTALLFVGLANPQLSGQRVAMRVSQGGHDVPAEKLLSRFPRTLNNLAQAITRLSHVVVYDNSDLSNPYRELAQFERGTTIQRATKLPKWFRDVLS